VSPKTKQNKAKIFADTPVGTTELKSIKNAINLKITDYHSVLKQFFKR
jgi:hypothetical protein